jgi:hypothetical protein
MVMQMDLASAATRPPCPCLGAWNRPLIGIRTFTIGVPEEI